MVTVLPFFSVLFYKFFTLGKNKPIEEKKEGINEPKTTGIRYGWANCRFSGNSPNFFTYVWQIGLAYLIYDTMFYWVHRALHIPQLYKTIHYVHHRFKTPVGIASSYAQSVESIAQMIMWWLPLGISGFIGADLHISTVFWYSTFRWLETVEAHSGYEIPFHPIRLLWIPAGARFHDFHHSHFDGNYGASKIWDWLMGTNKAYLEYQKASLSK